MKTEKEVMDALVVLSDYSNCLSNDELPNILTSFMEKEHRTLQQNLMKSFIQLIINYSKFRTDLRNEYTVNTAKKIVEAIKSDIYDEKYYAPLI
jgi:hypothetical protein